METVFQRLFDRHDVVDSLGQKGVNLALHIGIGFEIVFGELDALNAISDLLDESAETILS